MCTTNSVSAMLSRCAPQHQHYERCRQKHRHPALPFPTLMCATQGTVDQHTHLPIVGLSDLKEVITRGAATSGAPAPALLRRTAAAICPPIARFELWQSRRVDCTGICSIRSLAPSMTVQQTQLQWVCGLTMSNFVSISSRSDGMTPSEGDATHKQLLSENLQQHRILFGTGMMWKLNLHTCSH